METARHIIPDIHGQHGKLEAALKALGFQHRRGAWRHPFGETVLFLGDFIDRGPEQRAVLRDVRDMIEAGSARAVMGNHELNAVHYHATDPVSGGALRPHNDKNTAQHAAFLAEFPPGAPDTRAWLDWMGRLPLYLDDGDIRVVHACWDAASIAFLVRETGDGRMTPYQVWQAARTQTAFGAAVETVVKGPEHDLPAGYVVHDKQGTARDRVRIKWWPQAQEAAPHWRDMAMSVPDPGELPDGPVPADLQAVIYPGNAKPVFFGHYWMHGKVVRQARNAMCLDYSAGIDGPLVSYRVEPGEQAVDPDRVRCHGDPHPAV
jgi:hypothetical protein